MTFLILRETAAKPMDHARLTSCPAADQLSHADVSMTREPEVTC
ncbi:hypothetical protein [Blastococcus sp. CT_GayMR16]|nr:hypothetical protein [Blastococcus sp. CT_GayMR16]